MEFNLDFDSIEGGFVSSVWGSIEYRVQKQFAVQNNKLVGFVGADKMAIPMRYNDITEASDTLE